MLLAPVEKFNYFWVLFESDGRTEQAIDRQIGAETTVMEIPSLMGYIEKRVNPEGLSGGFSQLQRERRYESPRGVFAV